jgi:hypothetical protein
MYLIELGVAVAQFERDIAFYLAASATNLSNPVFEAFWQTNLQALSVS